jgi:hypothetical protein
MKNRIIVEVQGGCVSGIYSDAPDYDQPVVFVVDLDLSELGEATIAQRHNIEPLDDASDIIKECLPP